MFCDRDSMKEMYELSCSKKQETGIGWNNVLIIAEFLLFPGTSTEDILSLQKRWFDLFKLKMSERDAAFAINSGNVFALVHQSHFDSFSKDMYQNCYIFDKDIGELRSSLLILSDEEADFLLNQSNSF